MGAPSTITGRLLSYEEANALQNVEDEGNSIIFNVQYYWLGSASDGDYVYNVYSVWGVYEGDFNDYTYNDDYDGLGVRPVIEINTSDIG